MACPPGNCAAWGAFRLCKPLPPIVIDGSYTPQELQLLWFCWRARSTGEYGGTTPVDLGFNTPGLIDISKTTNIAKIIAYCDSRGTLVRQFTNFSRFGVKFNLPNFQASGSFSTWSGGVFGGATSPGGGGGSGGGGGEDPVGSDPTGGGTSGGGGGGGATCPCTPDGGSDLTVVVCTDIDCETEEPEIEITVCGGTPPYQWSTSGGGGGSPVVVQSGTNNLNVRATPPTTEDIAGEAYQKVLYSLKTSGCVVGTNVSSGYSCQDVSLQNCDSSPTADCLGAGAAFCREVACPDDESVPCWDVISGGVCGSAGACNGCDKVLAGEGAVCDVRSQQMIDDGCIPCGIAMDGLSITVTDSLGTEVTTVISA